MRLLFCMDTFPLYGTLESLQFAQELNARGHEILVATSSQSVHGERRLFDSVGGIPVTLFRSFHLPKVPYVITPFSYFETKRVIDDFEPDVVLAFHYVHFTTNMAVRAAHSLEVPAVLGIRGPGTSFGVSGASTLKNLWTRTGGKTTIEESSKVLFDSKASLNQYTKLVPPDKRELVYSVVDGRRFTFQEEKWALPPTIIHIGSLTPTKGVDTLIRAFQKVTREVQNARLLIVGDGASRQYLESLAVSLGIESSVSFLGYRSDIPEILTGANIFAITSVSEGISRSLLEAGASGCACVGSDVGGTPEVIDAGHNGFLFPSGDIDALTQELILLCKSPARRREFGAEISDKIRQRFEIEPVVDHLEEILRGVAG